MESTRQLSSDMTFEVLSRTSLQTLDSSRLICKDWSNLTYDSNFMEHHSRNTSTVSGYLVQSLIHGKYKSKFLSTNGDESSNMSLEFLPRNMKILASCEQGLFVYENRQNHRHYRYYICKPSIKEVVPLPNPKLRYLTEKVALVVLASNPLHYKIIRFSRGSIDYEKSRCEIFDSRIWAWKESTDLLLPYGEFLKSCYPAICASGTVHIVTNKDRVMAFDIDSESYCIFPLPIPAIDGDNYTRRRLVKYKGRLGFTSRAPNGCLELWVMNKCIQKEPFWKKRLTLETQVLEANESHPTLGAFYNSGVALVEGYRKAIFYNIGNLNMNVVRLENQPEEFLAFRSDFEPTDLKGR